MNLLIIILLMKCVYLFGEKIYTKQLRGMSEENLSKILIEELFGGKKIYKKQLRDMPDKNLSNILIEELATTIMSIHDKIIKRAKTGVNEYKFTIMCIKNQNTIPNCHDYDGHKEWMRSYPNSILSISKTYTTREDFTTSLIDVLQYTFPDTNITKVYKNCCDGYQIEW
jgi:hypothetical protein